MRDNPQNDLMMLAYNMEYEMTDHKLEPKKVKEMDAKQMEEVLAVLTDCMKENNIHVLNIANNSNLVIDDTLDDGQLKGFLFGN